MHTSRSVLLYFWLLGLHVVGFLVTFGLVLRGSECATPEEFMEQDHEDVRVTRALIELAVALLTERSLKAVSSDW